MPQILSPPRRLIDPPVSGGARSATDPNLLLQPGKPEGLFASNYSPSTGERISQGLDWLTQALGGSRLRGQQIGYGGSTLWNNFTPMAAAEEAGYQGGGGNKSGAALAALGAIPGVGPEEKAGVDAARNELARIRAYHGSPHSFDQFDLSKINTGEGAQAYGHGLYFAENEGVARGYRDTLSTSKISHPQWGDNLGFMRLDANFSNAAVNASPNIGMKLADEIGTQVSEGLRQGDDIAHMRKFVAQSDWSDAEKAAWKGALDHAAEYQVTPNPGHMYEVNINADPNHMLDWDKPLSEQPNIRDLTAKMGLKSADAPYSGWPGNRAGQRIQSVEGLLESLGGKGIAEQKLSEAGVPGIKYLDQGSRTAGAGTSNYVVFDDKLVNIVRKYGIAGALSAGLLTAEQARQFAGQQGNQQQGQGGT